MYYGKLLIWIHMDICCHLLPGVTLKHAGMFRQILALPSCLRFMSIPEILVSQTALASCWLPMDHRECIRMLGNAIATSHALSGLVNVLPFFNEMSQWHVHDIMLEAMSKRMNLGTWKMFFF